MEFRVFVDRQTLKKHNDRSMLDKKSKCGYRILINLQNAQAKGNYVPTSG